ncbi:MAG: 5-methylcytosine-specific restriction endonuclease system specificity protein McrC [Planctomycetia bacterium]|nr:5-methylcytosine-specific restriction endonuclease system specificity protein McrC [Planctomycetia bacterium]
MTENSHKGIAVKNIYYMLTYAFEILRERDYDALSTEEFVHIDDMMAAILILGLSSQIKRGLNREYLIKDEELTTLRGKIALSATLKSQSHLKRSLFCQYDEFSEDNLMNQIMKTAAWQLLRSPDVKLKKRRELKKLLGAFANVQLLHNLKISWNSLKFHRNNATCRMLMAICQMIIERHLMSSVHGTTNLKNYEDDREMCRLYERFVLRYFQKHYPQYNASSIHIKWNLDDEFMDFLPAMKTDITLKYGNKTLIIDTKWYSKTMQYHEQWHSMTCHSANLYQIFTYVKNHDRNRSGNVSGLLLYAKTDEVLTPNFDYRIGGNAISVKTLDLSGDWPAIDSQLKKIAACLES